MLPARAAFRLKPCAQCGCWPGEVLDRAAGPDTAAGGGRVSTGIVTIAVAVAYRLGVAGRGRPSRTASRRRPWSQRSTARSPSEFCRGRLQRPRDRQPARRTCSATPNSGGQSGCLQKYLSRLTRCGLSDGRSAPSSSASSDCPAKLVSEQRRHHPHQWRPSRRAVHRSQLGEDTRADQPAPRQRLATYFVLGRQPDLTPATLASVGNPASRQPDRPCDAHVLAAQPRFVPLASRRLEPGMEAAGIEPA